VIGDSSGATNTVITQGELEMYSLLREQMEAIKQVVEEQRLRLIQLVQGNAQVEPGRLVIEVRESVQRRVTKDFLVAEMGLDGYEDMRNEAPAVVSRRLHVRERAGGWHRPAGGSTQAW